MFQLRKSQYYTLLRYVWAKKKPILHTSARCLGQEKANITHFCEMFGPRKSQYYTLLRDVWAKKKPILHTSAQCLGEEKANITHFCAMFGPRKSQYYLSFESKFSWGRGAGFQSFSFQSVPMPGCVCLMDCVVGTCSVCVSQNVLYVCVVCASWTVLCSVSQTVDVSVVYVSYWVCCMYL